MKSALIALSFVGLLGSAVVFAQDGGVKRTVLQRTDVPAGAAQEAVVGTAEIAPGASIGRHTHAGVELGYIVSGEFELTVEGETPRRLASGDSYIVAAGKIHDARNIGTTPGKALATWVVSKGQPLAQPAK